MYFSFSTLNTYESNNMVNYVSNCCSDKKTERFMESDWDTLITSLLIIV